MANRKLLAAQMDGHYFLMADHGMLGIINPKRKLTNTVEIDLKQEPGLFPARDILARSAGFLANGGQIGMLGRTASQIEKATLPRPRTANDQSSILGSIIYIDNFGNLISNITRTRFYKVGKQRSFRVLLPRNKSINSISQSYYDKSKGSLLALFNSHGLLEVAISGSRARF
ncbi:MAG: SAM hydroxide adenosyltransferase [Owenweeksia sp.]|nr:SAM hydroxide adenosyltransferase [Owenweeksia sp.]